MNQFQITVLLEVVQNNPLQVDMEMFSTLANTIPAYQLIALREAIPYSPWQSDEVRTVVLQLLKYTRLKSPRRFPYTCKVGGIYNGCISI